MAITMNQVPSGVAASPEKLTSLKRYILRRSHPVSMFIEVVGLSWFTYYLWNHLWQEAILVIVVSRIVANIAVFQVDTDSLAQTTLGKMALLHLSGLNMIVQSLGAIGFIYGLWSHETRMILAGVSMMLLGHLQGWARVDSRLNLS